MSATAETNDPRSAEIERQIADTYLLLGAAQHRLDVARRSATPQRIAELEHEVEELRDKLARACEAQLTELENELRSANAEDVREELRK